jgi:hypothetical protein
MKLRRLPNGLSTNTGAPSASALAATDAPPPPDRARRLSRSARRRNQLARQVRTQQWNSYGAPVFVARYAGAYAVWRVRGYGHRGALRRIPLEIETDWRSRRGE